MDDESADKLLTPALLAGQLQIRDAIPHLRVLETSEYVGLYGGSMDRNVSPGAINPFYIQESLFVRFRSCRFDGLGESPKTLPVFAFPKHRVDGVFRPEPQDEREKLVASIKRGMSAREVLDVLGSPDFVSYPECSYDLDGDDPRTAAISWDAHQVKGVKLTKARWKDGLASDKLVVEY